MTMQLWNQRRLPELAAEGATGRCCSLDDVYDARHVAQRSGIPYYVVNFEERSSSRWSSRSSTNIWPGGRRFRARCATTSSSSTSFWRWRRASARSRSPRGITRASTSNERDGPVGIAQGVDERKDQTYFLFGLTQEQLARTLFPLGGMEKPEVRELAREMGCPWPEKPTARRSASCRTAIMRRSSMAISASRAGQPQSRAGEIVDCDGRRLGEHAGVHHFTVGQRRGWALRRASRST